MSAASHHDAAVLRQSFAKYDADGSGAIDVRELRALMHDVTGEEPTEAETADFARAVDTDGDGDISAEEMRAGLTKVTCKEGDRFALSADLDNGRLLVYQAPEHTEEVVARGGHHAFLRLLARGSTTELRAQAAWGWPRPGSSLKCRQMSMS